MVNMIMELMRQDELTLNDLLGRNAGTRIVGTLRHQGDIEVGGGCLERSIHCQQNEMGQSLQFGFLCESAMHMQ